MLSAINWASIFRLASFFDIDVHRHPSFCNWRFQQLDIFTFLPITTPDGALNGDVMRAFLAGRSITILLTGACANLELQKERTLMSSFSMVAKF